MNVKVHSRSLFSLHVQCHALGKEIDNAKQKIVFYALYVLYVLSVAVVALDTVTAFVSNNSAFFFNFVLISCAHRLMTE